VTYRETMTYVVKISGPWNVV